jgi:hypothetical protein
MSFLFMESFDPIAAVSDLLIKGFTAANGGSMVAAVNTAFGTGQAIQTTNNAPLLQAIWDSASNETIIDFSLRIKYNSASPTGGNYICLTFLDAANSQCSILFNGDGSITTKSGGSAGSTITNHTGAFILNTWVSFQGRVVINNTTGAISIARNGAGASGALFNDTGANTRGGSTNNYVNGFRIDANNALFQLDDLWFNNEDGTPPNTWPGDIRIYYSPVASDIQKQFTTSDGSSNYILLNDAAQNGDTSYVYSSTVGQQDIYGIAGLSGLNPGHIVGVRPLVLWRTTDIGSHTATIGINANSSGDVTKITGSGLTLSYNYNQIFLPKDPTNANWTIAKINSLQLSLTLAS